MPEYSDVYTQHGTPTGRVRLSTEKMRTGEYYLHTIIILRAQSGQYLLQQRSMKKRYLPGKWDVTGGGVQAGETGLTAAIRETQEELGLTFPAEQFIYAGRIPLGENGWLDMWGITADFAEKDCVLRTDEVDAVRLTDYETFRDTIRYNKDDLFMALVDALHGKLESI